MTEKEKMLRQMLYNANYDADLIRVRKKIRYRNTEVEYLDSSWKKRRQTFSGLTAQALRHEIDLSWRALSYDACK